MDDRVTPVIGRDPASQPLLASTETRLTSSVRLWLILLVAELALFAVSVGVYCANEHWSFEKALYVSVSIGFGIGMPYRTSEATAVYACANALVGFALLAGAASLLVRRIVLRQEQVRREVREEIRGSELTHLTMMFNEDEGVEQPASRAAARCGGGGSGGGQGDALGEAGFGRRRSLRRFGKGLRSSMRAARGHLLTKSGRRWMLCLLWLALWAVGMLTFATSIAAVQGPQETKYGTRVYGLLWLVSIFTTSSLGVMTPLDNPASFLWAAAFIVVGVPLTATVYASFIDVYIAHVERREARRTLLHLAVPSRTTFLSMGAEERRTLTGAKVDWGAYLEYRLRSMPGTVVHEKLLDGLRATFAAIDVNNNGFIEWRDIESHIEAQGIISNADVPGGLPDERMTQ